MSKESQKRIFLFLLVVGLIQAMILAPNAVLAGPPPGEGVFIGVEETESQVHGNQTPLCATVTNGKTTITKEQTGTFTANDGSKVGVFSGKTFVTVRNTSTYYIGPDGTHLASNCTDTPGQLIPVSTTSAGIDSIPNSGDNSVNCGTMTGTFRRVGQATVMTLSGSCTVNGPLPGAQDQATQTVTETEVGDLQPCGFGPPPEGEPVLVNCQPEGPVISYAGTYTVN